MMMKKRYMRVSGVLIMAFLLMFTACGCGGRAKVKQEDENQKSKSELKQIQPPTIPSVMYGEERAIYLAKHYWDNFDFNDTSYINQPEVTEQYLANYFGVLNQIHPEIAESTFRAMLEKADSDSLVYGYFNELFDKYLYEEYSPVKNEELLIIALQKLLNSDKVDSLYKIRPKVQLRMVTKNRVGDIAADIAVTVASGAVRTLHGVRSDYVLLFFNNPDCSSCAMIEQGMEHSQLLMPLIEEGKMEVFMVYPDEDLEAWRKNLPSIPSGWINGYDARFMIREKELYNLKAIPSLYLLDKNKRVLIKDAPSHEAIEHYFYYVAKM